VVIAGLLAAAMAVVGLRWAATGEQVRADREWAPPTWVLPRPPVTTEATVAPEPTTTLPPEPERVPVDTGRGRQLLVGSAGPVGSPATVADAVGSQVPLFSNPGDPEPGEWLDNPTWEGLSVVFLVHQQVGDWLRVQVSMRPNQATAWVRASDVTLRRTPYEIVVDATALRLVLYQEGRPLFEAPVAVGKGSTPTPLGHFFVDGIVALRDASGPYGSHQLSVAAFSNVHYSFGGGVGQIALHGTNSPDLIGTPVSNGCVRMHNADISRLASLVPTGTPVRIVA
jgi:lipoprotein-anchoring transpeptidase ErfK/SrfK